MTEIVGLERHLWAWVVAGVFAFLATLVTLFSIKGHCQQNNSPMAKFQIRILFMVPVYSIEAWLGLYQKEYTLYWDVLRECYEAMVIYSFYQFLVTYLQGEEQLHQILQNKHHGNEHPSPFKYCLKPWGLKDGEFHYKVKLGILQYVPVKLLMALLTFILDATHNYHNGTFKLSVGYPYIAFITNASQLWAMYCLVLFYHCLLDEIKSIQPLAKFLSIKLVVFFTFWQSVLISGAVAAGKLHSTQTYTEEEVASGLQDFIICIEMLIAAIAHIYVYPADEFHDPEVEFAPHMHRFSSVLIPHDLVHDMKSTMVAPVGAHIAKKTEKIKSPKFGCFPIGGSQVGADGRLVDATGAVDDEPEYRQIVDPSPSQPLTAELPPPSDVAEEPEENQSNENV